MATTKKTDRPTMPMPLLLPIPVREIVAALERESANTDTDPRWLAASELRRMEGWETRTLICRPDQRPTQREQSCPDQ